IVPSSWYTDLLLANRGGHDRLHPRPSKGGIAHAATGCPTLRGVVGRSDVARRGVPRSGDHLPQGGECRGTNKADQISGTIGVDQIYALGGDDSVQGGEGADLIKGGLGADLLKSGSDADTIYGGDGNDTANGAIGNDYFDGGAGNDRLSGGDENDIITAADGLVDEIDCGLGLDTVVSHGTGLDIVADSCETSIPAAATVAGN